MQFPTQVVAAVSAIFKLQVNDWLAIAGAIALVVWFLLGAYTPSLKVAISHSRVYQGSAMDAVIVTVTITNPSRYLLVLQSADVFWVPIDADSGEKGEVTQTSLHDVRRLEWSELLMKHTYSQRKGRTQNLAPSDETQLSAVHLIPNDQMTLVDVRIAAAARLRKSIRWTGLLKQWGTMQWNATAVSVPVPTTQEGANR